MALGDFISFSRLPRQAPRGTSGGSTRAFGSPAAEFQPPAGFSHTPASASSSGTFWADLVNDAASIPYNRQVALDASEAIFDARVGPQFDVARDLAQQQYEWDAALAYDDYLNSTRDIGFAQRLLGLDRTALANQRANAAAQAAYAGRQREFAGRQFGITNRQLDITSEEAAARAEQAERANRSDATARAAMFTAGRRHRTQDIFEQLARDQRGVGLGREQAGLTRDRALAAADRAQSSAANTMKGLDIQAQRYGIQGEQLDAALEDAATKLGITNDELENVREAMNRDLNAEETAALTEFLDTAMMIQDAFGLSPETWLTIRRNNPTLNPVNAADRNIFTKGPIQ